MTESEIAAVVKKATIEAMEEKLGEFYIEREQHFLDHQFVSDIRTFNEKIKGQACKTVTNGILAAIGIILVWGLYHAVGIVTGRWGKP